MAKIKIILTAIGLMFGANANAVVHTYNFSGAPINGTGITTITSFATLTIDDVSDLFTLSLGNLSAFGPNARASGLAVAYSIQNPSFTISNISGGVSNVTINTANAPGSAFDIRFDIGGTPVNQAQNRLTSNETVSWVAQDFDLSKLTAASGPNPNAINGYTGSFALRIQGAGQNSNGNAWYGATLVSAVPEPETYVMMLAGLALVGFASRRKA